MPDVARLGFVIDSTQVRQAGTELDRMTAAGRRAEQQKDRLAQTTDRLNSRFNTMVGQIRALQAVFAAIAASQVLRFFADLFDRMNLVEARLRLVTRSTAELANVQSALFDIAQRSRTEFESTATLYFRIARSADELGKSQQELLRLTEIINQAIQVGGATAQEASAGIIQLSQAMASGTLRGDELRSVLENLPRLAQAIARGMGVTVGQLRALGQAGQLASKEIADALLTQGAVIEREFAEIPRTISGAVIQAANEFDRLFHEMDRNQRLSENFTYIVDGLKDAFKDLAQYISDSVDEWRRLEALYQRLLAAVTITREERLKQIDETIAGIRTAPVVTPGPTTGTGIGFVSPSQHAQNQAIETRITLLEQERAAITRQIGAEHQLAEALAANAAATEEANAATQRRRELTDEEARALERARKAQLERVLELNEEIAAQDKAYAALQKIIDGLKRERAELLLSERERFIRNELLKAEQIIKEELIDDGDKYLRQIRAEAGALYDANRAYEANQEALERRAELLEQPFENAIENIQRAFGDMFSDIFENGLDSAADFSNTLKRIFARLAGEIASAMIITPILNGVGVTTSSAGGTSLTGVGGSSFNLGNVQNLFASNSNAGIQGVPPHGAGGVPAGQTLQSPGGGFGSNFSFLGAGLGVTASIGDIINGLNASGPGATYGQLGSGIGGAIGSIAGSFFGPVGGIVGQMLGSMLGGIVGGFISAPNNYPKAASYLQVGPGGTLIGAGTGTANDATTEIIQASKDLRDSAATSINALAAVLGGTFGQGDLGYFGPGGIGGIQVKAGNFNTVVGTKSEKFGKDRDAALENYIVEVIAQSVRNGLLTGLGEGVTKALSGDKDYDTLKDLLRDINLGRLADGLGILSDSAIGFQAEMIQLQEEFEATKKRAEELGFSIGGQLQEQLDSAQKALEERYFGQFREFAASLQQGPLSTLTGEQKFFEARTAYNDIERRALGGDAGAQAQFIGAAQTYLGLAREQFASTSSYATIYDQVLAATRQLGTAPALDTAPVVNAVNDNTQQVVGAINSLENGIKRELRLDRAERRTGRDSRR